MVQVHNAEKEATSPDVLSPLISPRSDVASPPPELASSPPHETPSSPPTNRRASVKKPLPKPPPGFTDTLKIPLSSSSPNVTSPAVGSPSFTAHTHHDEPASSHSHSSHSRSSSSPAMNVARVVGTVVASALGYDFKDVQVCNSCNRCKILIYSNRKCCKLSLKQLGLSSSLLKI